MICDTCKKKNWDSCMHKSQYARDRLKDCPMYEYHCYTVGDFNKKVK